MEGMRKRLPAMQATACTLHRDCPSNGHMPPAPSTASAPSTPSRFSHLLNGDALGLRQQKEDEDAHNDNKSSKE